MAVDERIEAGRTALRAGRWEDARRAFETSLADQETAEALEGIAEALWWLCEARASVRYRERAYVRFRRDNDLARAAMAAVNLSIHYLVNLGNDAAARGWLERAEGLLDQVGPHPGRGWVLLMRGFLSADPEVTRDLLAQALQCAREAGDSDLELVALSDLGMALVAAGRTQEGMALLDEAMAGTLGGEYSRLDTVVFTSCNMLAACSLVGDLERASQWCRVADDFMRDYSCPFLFARCRVHYGSVLVAKGQWGRAESELQAALDMSHDAGAGPHAEALARLADLRFRQGRLEEAEALIAALENDAAAMPAAAVRMARGQPSVAAALLERSLKRLGDEHVELPSILAMLIDARIRSGDIEGGRAAARRLDSLARGRGTDHPAALAKLASAHVLRAEGHDDEAVDALEEALDRFSRLDLPLETARVRLELAQALAERQPDVAVAEGTIALEAFEELGASTDVDAAAALLRSLGAPARTGPKHAGVLTKREQEVLGLVGLGLSNPEIAARLFISRKTAAHHVSSVLAKLGLRNRAEAVRYATRSPD